MFRLSLVTFVVISMRFSADKGVSFGNAVTQSMGATGQYQTSVQWQRIGMARDGVFEFSWSGDTNMAMNGAWVNFLEHST